ncbi:hypothetical protein WR25_12744 [Diploscapter pachys]|uniref:ZP domain-containing protein n=1 Tax=Diploscapter pachys TaxID=2018661 RepID=A0A2A2JVG0_9BILA|nr:hypothetical protein WR25_12744 [Diploscapter pachys]
MICTTKMLLLFYLIIKSAFANRCIGDNSTTYLRSESTRLMDFSTHTIKNVTLNVCANHCTEELQGHDCLSFEYDAVNQECSIHKEDGQPFGPSILVKADSALSYFQQICVKGKNLCAAPYSFERFPQSVLVGHAMRVEPTEGLSECLSLCLDAQADQQLPCKSVMYYYETGECVMNRETRLTQPRLFKKGIQDSLVDYFENVCLDTNLRCSDASYSQIPNKRNSQPSYKTIATSSVHQCLAECLKEGPNCASVVFDYAEDECQLSSASDYTSSSSSSNANSLDYFDKICDSAPSADFSPRPPTTAATSNRTRAKGVGNYAVAPNVISTTQPLIDGDTNTEEKEIDEFLKNQLNTTTQPEEREQISGDTNEFSKDNRIDAETKAVVDGLNELERANQGAVEPTLSVGSRSINTQGKLADPSTPNTIEQTQVEASSTVIDDTDEFTKTQGQSGQTDSTDAPVKAHLSSECRMSGITVSVTFAENTSGAIYIKEHFSTCKAAFNDSTSAELHIPFPNRDDANPRCPGAEIAPAQWSFIVVVQRDEMKSLSLVTSTDRVFNVTCDYTELLEKENVNIAQIDEDKSKRIQMQILYGGVPVTTVPLGAVVELRWTVLENANNYGFFVNECVAERIGGTPPEPEPLKIIYQGCPEEKVRNRLLKEPILQETGFYATKMKVFRFDGSRRVRIKCTVDVCIDSCPSFFEVSYFEGSNCALKSQGPSSTSCAALQQLFRSQIGDRSRIMQHLNLETLKDSAR